MADEHAALGRQVTLSQMNVPNSYFSHARADCYPSKFLHSCKALVEVFGPFVR